MHSTTDSKDKIEHVYMYFITEGVENENFVNVWTISLIFQF